MLVNDVAVISASVEPVVSHNDPDDSMETEMFPLHNPSNLFQQLLLNRIEQEIQAQRLDEAAFQDALLASREEYDAMDTTIRNENISFTGTAQKYSTINIKNKRKETCSICQENYSCNQEVYWLSCKHICHKECLDEWVKYKAECPVCRDPLQTLTTESCDS